MKRFQLYKKLGNGSLMHVTSILANNILDAENEISKLKSWNCFDRKNYKITGLTYNRN